MLRRGGYVFRRLLRRCARWGHGHTQKATGSSSSSSSFLSKRSTLTRSLLALQYSARLDLVWKQVNFHRQPTNKLLRNSFVFGRKQFRSVSPKGEIITKSYLFRGHLKNNNIKKISKILVVDFFCSSVQVRGFKRCWPPSTWSRTRDQKGNRAPSSPLPPPPPPLPPRLFPSVCLYYYYNRRRNVAPLKPAVSVEFVVYRFDI